MADDPEFNDSTDDQGSDLSTGEYADELAEERIGKRLREAIAKAATSAERQELLLEAARSRIHLLARRTQRLALLAAAIEGDVKVVKARIPDRLSESLNTLSHDVGALRAWQAEITGKVDAIRDSVALFPLVKLIVFGVVGLICVGVFGALMALVIVQRVGAGGP